MLKWLALLALAIGVPASAVSLSPSEAGGAAVTAFDEVCLKTRGAGIDAVIAAITRRTGVTEQPSLPAYSGGKPMRLFTDGTLEYLVRPGKRGQYGCFVAIDSKDDATAAAAKTGLDGLANWKAKPIKPGKKIFFEWTTAGSKDEIRLTPKSDIGAILINLEVIS